MKQYPLLPGWIGRAAAAALFTLGLSMGIAQEQPAPTNSPAAEVKPPPPKWETTAYAGLTLTSGNSDTFLASLSIETKRKWAKDELALGITGAYGESDSVKNQETVYGFGQYNRLITERFYFGTRADALYDGISGVDFRAKISPLAGYYLIKNAKTSLSVETGPSVVFEQLEGVESDTYMGIRFGEKFEHKFTETTRVWQALEYTPQVDRWMDKYLFLGEIGAEAAITKKVGLRTVLQDIYDSEPSPGREKNDIRLLAGITYKF
jgi:putative salt-induced outer membrane protein YdiY